MSAVPKGRGGVRPSKETLLWAAASALVLLTAFLWICHLNGTM
jgi:hypothetical protein